MLRPGLSKGPWTHEEDAIEAATELLDTLWILYGYFMDTLWILYDTLWKPQLIVREMVLRRAAASRRIKVSFTLSKTSLEWNDV